ncbi:hypothetical protein TNCV_1194991 [Trichonephila clavipes]|nr:hypothetical protein TNCV_1194991 [Trichonephila clavipes]
MPLLLEGNNKNEIKTVFYGFIKKCMWSEGANTRLGRAYFKGQLFNLRRKIIVLASTPDLEINNARDGKKNLNESKAKEVKPDNKQQKKNQLIASI